MSRSILLNLVCLLGLLGLPGLGACGGGAEEERAEPVSHATDDGHVHVGEASGFGNLAMTCCSTGIATQVVMTYVEMSAALAADDAALAGQRAAALALALEAASVDATLSESSRSKARGLKDLATKLASRDIAGIRRPFSGLSDMVIAFARENQGEPSPGEVGGETSGSHPVVVGFCPMAPGRWLQSESELANPYFGSEMLRCGVFEEL